MPGPSPAPGTWEESDGGVTAVCERPREPRAAEQGQGAEPETTGGEASSQARPLPACQLGPEDIRSLGLGQWWLSLSRLPLAPGRRGG